MEFYNSLKTFDEYLQYGMDYVDDKVIYHPFGGKYGSRKNCYEGTDEFRSKLKELNRLGIYTNISQPSELSNSLDSTNMENTWIQYPFVSGIMDKNKAYALLKIINDTKSDNLIYVIDNNTNYDAQKHSNLMVFNKSVKVSYYLHESNSEINGTWFSLNNNFIDGNNTVMNIIIPNLDANNYCFVGFMDNRVNNELFDNLIDLLKIA